MNKTLLESIINPSLIDLNLKSKNKDGVIKELSLILKENGYISDYEQLVEDIYKRESEGITGIGNNVAIPHAKSSSVNNVCVAIGKTASSIEWESYDGKPVSLFFLLATPDNKEGSGDHLKLLSQIASRLANEELLEQIKNTNNKKDLINLLMD